MRAMPAAAVPTTSMTGVNEASVSAMEIRASACGSSSTTRTRTLVKSGVRRLEGAAVSRDSRRSTRLIGHVLPRGRYVGAQPFTELFILLVFLLTLTDRDAKERHDR